ncbi:allophanate hydrolase [Variovorax sp. J22P168]|uniref:allophanate hydrolase n=1 Tax=Variovorax jilinensis TaxID=3053513 RepID=UPI0025775212|nr:allophanate hydrolase [Variovorax sp. J22P168]MDM0015708.1 allophanate hydrolase [Variovorax sp. J22P168]
MVHEDAVPAGPAGNFLEGAAAAAWITRLAAPLAGAAGGPLAGLQFAAKDNIDVADVPTTAACPAFARTPAVHAQVVQRLLDAGAALHGKTNLDQFACGLNGTRSPYGPVPNSFDARYVSGGSSSGSAYVVATGQVDFALGTDTAGSGRVPAGLNNIVGIKPTRGLISARGVVPAAQSVDCVSIFARTVAVAARVLQAAIGFDPEDPFARSLELETRPLPAQFRFGVPSRLRFFGDTQAEAAFERSLAQLRALGGSPVEIDYSPLSEAAALLYDSALVAERYAAVRDFFDGHDSEVIEPVRGILAQGRGYGAADFVDARVKLQALGQRAAAIWADIDVLLVPTAPAHYTIAAMQADPVALNRNLGEYTNFVNLLDYAAISVPACLREDGLPFGITLIGRAGSDFQLAELGQRFHHATGLALGATGQPLPPPETLPQIAPVPTVRVAVVGAHLSGMPLNGQLTERGARLVEATHTAADYRLYALPGTVPPKPGLARVAPGEGAAIAVEIWEMPLAHYGSFVALIPAPLGIGTLALAGGRSVQGFLCESLALDGADDITSLGGWRAYMAQRTAPAPA